MLEKYKTGNFIYFMLPYILEEDSSNAIFEYIPAGMCRVLT